MGLANGEQRGREEVLTSPPAFCCLPLWVWDKRKKGSRYSLQGCPGRLQSSPRDYAAPVRRHGAPCELNPNYGLPFTFPTDNASSLCCRGPGQPRPFHLLSVGPVDIAPVCPRHWKGVILAPRPQAALTKLHLSILQHQTLPQIRFPRSRL